MGIKGLLPALDSVVEKKFISDFSGKEVSVDGHGKP